MTLGPVSGPGFPPDVKGSLCLMEWTPEGEEGRTEGEEGADAYSN